MNYEQEYLQYINGNFFMNYEQERVRIDTYGSIIRCDNSRINSEKKKNYYVYQQKEVAK